MFGRPLRAVKMPSRRSTPRSGGGTLARSIGSLLGAAVRVQTEASSSASVYVTESGSAASDWLARSTASGVVRAIRFDTAAPVNAFRFSDGIGHDPTPAPGSVGSYVRWNSTGGILGDGCLELEQLTSGNMNSLWWLPFDPAKSTYQFNETGYNRGPGQEFYVQVRMKTNCGGASSTGGGGRKMFSVSRLTQSYTFNEIVYQDTLYRGIAQMYQGLSGSGVAYAGFEEPAGGSDFNLQPGGNYNVLPAYCSYQAGDYVNQAACWDLHNGEWVTYLLHVVPSTDGVANGTVELFGAAQNDTAYTLLIRKANFALRYDADKPAGYNAFIAWIYETGRTAGAANQKQWYDQIILSTQPIACPQPRPTWFSPSLNTWFSTNAKISDAQTYTEPSGASHAGFCAYSGAALLGTTIYVAGSGHLDGASNAVIAVDLSLNAPAFTLRRGPTAAVTQNATYYGDGRPGARHTGWEIQGIAERGRIFFFGGWAYYGNGGTAANNVDAFRLSTNDYDAAGTYAAQASLQSGNAPNAVCQDASGNVYVWSNGTGLLYKWTQATAAWSTMPNSAASVIYNSPMAYDPVRNRLVLLDGANSRYYNLNTNTQTGFSGPARSASFFWCDDIGAFLYKSFGATTIQRIDPVTFAATTYTVAGTPPAEASDGVNQMYGRIGYCPALGIVYAITQTSTNLHAFRTR